MRSLLALAACSLLSIIPAACSSESNGGAPAPPPAIDAGQEDAPAPEPEPPADNPLVIELGEVQAGAETTFEIPKGALGFNITAEGTAADLDPERPFGIQRITAPDGNVVHDNFTPKGGTVPTSLAFFDAIASASVPQSENAPTDLAGTWKVRFGVSGSIAKLKLKGRVRVQSSGDGAFHGGQLDLVVHLPEGLMIGDQVVDAAKPADDPGIADRLDLFFTMTSELLGIARGNVSFQKEDRSYRELDGYDAFLRGFAVSKGEKDGTQALHILLTNQLTMDGQPYAAGLSGGIPGAATTFGRGVSGVILKTSDFGEQDAVNLLHEVGHFFGLNHTTELDGGDADPLSDTPVCEKISRFPEDLMQCPDRTNVMFAAGALEGPVTLSPSQKRVYRGSPVYRAFTPRSGGSTMSLARSTPPSIERRFRISGSNVLSPVERELSFGFCGLNALDANGLVKRHGRDAAIAQLRAAAADPDLVPYIRGRANLALKALGAL